MDELLTRPIPATIHFQPEAWSVIGSASTPREILTSLADLIDLSPASPRPGRPAVSFPVPEVSGIPDGLRRALAEFITRLGQADRMVEEALSPLDDETRAFLRSRSDLLGIGGDNLEVDWDEREAVRYLRTAEKMDRSMIIAAGLVSLSGLETFLATINRLSQEGTLSGLDGAGRPLLDFSTPWGRVLVGGIERNTYRDPALLILDLGGDDVYQNRAGGTEAGQQVAVVVDLAGDDLYMTEKTGAQGAGLLGIGLLVDLAGDDEYRAGDFAQGASLFGVGIHWDREGRDSFRAKQFAQGAGAFGVGILLDEAGTDAYTVQAFAQGFGLTGGAGLLLDRQGDDQYVSLGGPPDYRQEGHHQSFAQGFGLGLRPLASGGVGILVDQEGADRYLADYFGQGGGYWYGLGALLDENGDDRYEATRYSQGAGIHLAVGLLIDRAGADLYRAWGVAQGVGHDLAFGWLRDLAGDDLYESHWLSQGAGSANGFGLLMDERGEDRYLGGEATVQGFGRIEREHEAIGILLDATGRDRYTGPGQDGSVWRQGEIGLGADDGTWPDFADQPASRLQRKGPPLGHHGETFYPHAPVLIVPDEPRLALLLKEASTFKAGEKAEAARLAAESELVEIGQEAVSYLVQVLRSADIGKVLVAMEVLKRIGPPAIPALREALGDPAWHVRRRAASLLSQIEDNEAFTSLLRAGLHDPDWGVRAKAATVIAQIGVVPKETLSALVRLVREDQDRDVRRSALLALAVIGDPRFIPVLLDSLRDRDFTVRRAASRALAKIPAAREPLLDFIARKGEDPLTISLARQALDQLEQR
ncbi:MAG: HEAT repeat domain-containing protein [candidate division NC10 bacterium]|nr:HEAT repeat domain-containing protein [candidate division NC10 bacterium]